MKRDDGLLQLFLQLEHLARSLDRERLALGLAAWLYLELEGRVERAVHDPRPPGAHRAIRTHDVHHLVMLEAGDRLGDDGVALPREPDDGGEVVVQAVPAALGVAVAEDRDRVAPSLEVPHDEVEEMHRLLEDPRSDLPAGVSPVLGAAAIREAEEGDQRVHRFADLARVDEPFDLPPLRRHAELVADAEHPLVRRRGRDQPVALRHCQRHRLFEEHVLAALERGHSDLGVQVRRYDDVDRLDAGILQELTVVAIHRNRGEIAPGDHGARFALAADPLERHAGSLP